MAKQILIFDPSQRTWIRFQSPFQILAAYTAAEVLPLLDAVERQVDAGHFAAGFISYEAAPAFDDALRTRPPENFPLCWFALCRSVAAVDLASCRRRTYRAEPWVPTIGPEKYRRDIEAIKAAIAAGDTYQVNYTYRLHSRISGDSFSFFLDLLNSQRTDYAAYLDTGAFQILSVSPELFFELNGDRIGSKPMKGTAPRGRLLAEDLENAEKLHRSGKNRAENVMIVDMIRNDLSRIARTGCVAVDSLFDIERYPTAWQMTSTVSARTDKSFSRILKALFPCASITGAPKPRTMEIIRRLETTPRKIYTGAIGYLLPGRVARFNVAIRTVLIDKPSGLAEYGIGGGIVWDSEEHEEFAESLTKARVLSDRRPGFALLETLRWTPEAAYFLREYHLERLKNSAAYFDYPFDDAKIIARLDQAAEQFPPTPQRVRLLLARNGEITCQAAALDVRPHPAPVRLKLARRRVDSRDPMRYHKTTDRDFYLAAKRQAGECDDVIFLNERSEVTEGCIYNIVIRLQGRLVTPAVQCGLLPGTFRAWLLDRGKIAEGIVRLKDLETASALYVINSVRKWQKAILF